MKELHCTNLTKTTTTTTKKPLIKNNVFADIDGL